MQKTLILLLILCFGCSAFSQFAQDAGGPPAKGLFVQPASIDFKLEAGQIGNKTISISNKTDKTVQFKVYLGDWERDSLGKHIYYDPNTKPYSCSGWLTLDKDFLEVESGKSVPLTLNLKIPDSAEAVEQMKWSMLFVEMINERTAIPDTGVTVVINKLFRMGIHVYQTPPNLVAKEMNLTGFKEVYYANDSIYYQMGAFNAGDVMIRCKGTLELTNLTTGSKSKVGPIEFPMFPGQRRLVNFRVPATLPKGKYSVVAVLDGGEDVDMAGARAQLEIK